MPEEVTEVIENVSSNHLKLYTIAEGARRLDINYNRLMYAIAKGWVSLYQDDPALIEESVLFEFAKERNIAIPKTL